MAAMTAGRIFVEDWKAAYAPPYLIPDDEDAPGDATVVEDGGSLTFHGGEPGLPGDLRLVFVDGVRRGDVSLYQEDEESGALARGIAASHACGAVLCEEAARPVIGEVRVTRLVVWGSGMVGSLPAVSGGWTWEPVSVPGSEPDAPLRAVQARMRQNEARLAEDLATAGWHVLVDGPLRLVRADCGSITGYVKTHSRSYLPAELHRRVRELRAGERTSIFAIGNSGPSHLYSCYARLRDPGSDGGPWYGIVRLEFPAVAGLQAVAAAADRLTGILPRYSSPPHTDPRAPQNLQPIGALERELRHRMGDSGLAVRAVRSAVVSLRQTPSFTRSPIP